jgi:hypothetical protein
MNRIDRVLDLLDQAEELMDKGGARQRVLEAIRLLEVEASDRGRTHGRNFPS